MANNIKIIKKFLFERILSLIPINSNFFDVIICNHVLEHIPDHKKAMREIYRVLKTGGWAILQVPILGEQTFEDPDATTPEAREKSFLFKFRYDKLIIGISNLSL